MTDHSYSAVVGERLRTIRNRQGYSLAQVGAATDISPSFLSLVETGKTSLTIERLMRLVRFYGTSVTDLLPETLQSNPLVVRSGEQRRVHMEIEGMDVLLLSTDTRRRMMPFFCDFAPGGETVELSSHEGEEFVHVVDGSLIVEIQGEAPIRLEAGDSLYFSSEVPHSYRNSSDGVTRILSVVTPPTL